MKRSGMHSRSGEPKGDLSDYQLSDSDYDYDEDEKILLEGARKKHGGERVVEEVFALPQSEESDDNEDDYDDDFEKDIDDYDDGLPSSKAWGQQKKAYYNTDYVDQDYGSFRGKDAELAEYEEQEANTIQERLVKEIDEADYMLEICETTTSKEEQEELEEKVPTDLTGLSKRQRRELFKKDSPEFSALVEDYKAKMSEVHEKLEPMLALIEEGKIPAVPLCKFVKIKYDLILNYCTNILFYLLLKSKRIPIQPHPVVQRLFQCRQLLKQLDDIDGILVAQIDEILEKVNNGEELKFKKTYENVSTPKLKNKTEKKEESEKEEIPFFQAARLPLTAFRANNDEVEDMDIDEMGDEDKLETPEQQPQGEEDNEEEDEDEQRERRAITYQIAKNKGLTPRRKKEQRNPRVKHRKKYEKAKVRRKGQVREVRREIHKYGGEISGIKIGITKSIKFH